MRELVYYVAVSLDGFIADADGGYEHFLVDGDHATVVFEEYADALPTHVLAALRLDAPQTRFDTVVMGWNTLRPALDAGIESPYAHLQQVVATRRGPDALGKASPIEIVDDPVARVRELKQLPGKDIWLCGGGELAGSLAPEIDRLILKRNPIVLGTGIPLFGTRGTLPRRFDLVDARPFESGVIVEEYATARGL